MVTNSVLTDKLDFSQYVGQWVVICDNKVVAHNKNLRSIENHIKGCKTTPTVAKIPKKETLIF
ncbi:MAG: hypothetical protein KKC54_00505 [Nanoarchaeota archaeon]|nr:hypothetical protein [Nanoarchaeota archaeon]MBU1945424.1 hypothetical protein [Nanoarchaeota archaeon]